MSTTRRIVAALALFLVAGGGTATAVTPATRVSLTKTFRTVLPKVQDTAGVPIRIPRIIYLATSHKLYATGAGQSNGYDLELAFAPNCGGANACFAADFLARGGGAAVGREPVGLAKGITGRFTPTSCGASCAPPGIEWRQNGVVYTLQVPGGATAAAERDALVSYANAAIRAPRL
jgi:hypothetical protein